MPQWPQRLVCVIALTEGTEKSKEMLTWYQKYIHKQFDTTFDTRKTAQSKVDVQYAMVNLKSNLDLNTFLKKTQKKFTMTKTPQYLVYVSDTEAFKIVSGTVFFVAFAEKTMKNIEKELPGAVEDFMSNAKASVKDYFGNYNTDLKSLLTRDDDNIAMVSFVFCCFLQPKTKTEKGIDNVAGVVVNSACCVGSWSSSICVREV